MDWQQFVMDLGDLDPDAVEAVLVRHGAGSVTLTDGGNTPVLEPGPGETPLWAQTRITGLFTAGTDFASLVADLEAQFGPAGLPPHRVLYLPGRDWEREWLRDFGPMRFGRRLWICPGDSVAPPGAVAVRLDPGLAFGTGTHPTTALCLEWLDGLALDGRSLLDYGCGSGVLAIAGLKLGCRGATALDIDPQALTATRRNAERNGVAERLRVAGRDAEVPGGFDVVVANILAGPLVELAECVITRLSSGGDLALSGILSGQVDRIQAAYDPWIAFDAPAFRSQGDQTWARLSGKRRSS
ncbi:MAG TPA: 50S ribosomal protein L11 methyltransferase [Woeseiaceae bacterium]|nr:50S ribosomal protein L11 methyltransferase [Woeseiaceae bacterium]